jgi:hypothetical protein
MPLQRPPWREIYASLRLPRLDRITRFIGWRRLHRALRCSATAVLWCKVGTVQELRAAVCCSATACAGDGALVGAQVESLSHLFVHCPVVQPAVAWLRGVWALLVAGRVPPLSLDVRVLLPGDHTVWDPGGGEAGAELWTHLCLLFCRAVWYMRCCRVDGCTPLRAGRKPVRRKALTDNMAQRNSQVILTCIKPNCVVQELPKVVVT